MLGKFKLDLGRRRLIGRFYEKEFNFSFLKNLHEFVSLKDFLCSKSTNRLLNDEWIFLCSQMGFFLGKEVSSLPPLADSVDMEGFQFVDLDFPELMAETVVFSKLRAEVLIFLVELKLRKMNF